MVLWSLKRNAVSDMIWALKRPLTVRLVNRGLKSLISKLLSPSLFFNLEKAFKMFSANLGLLERHLSWSLPNHRGSIAHV